MPWSQKIIRALDTLTMLQPSERRKESSGNFQKNASNTASYIPLVKQGKMWSTHSKVLSNWKSGPAVWYECPPKAHVLKVLFPAGGAVGVCALIISRPYGSGAWWEEFYQVGRWVCVSPALSCLSFCFHVKAVLPDHTPPLLCSASPQTAKKWDQVTKERNLWDWAKRISLNCVWVYVTGGNANVSVVNFLRKRTG